MRLQRAKFRYASLVLVISLDPRIVPSSLATLMIFNDLAPPATASLMDLSTAKRASQSHYEYAKDTFIFSYVALPHASQRQILRMTSSPLHPPAGPTLPPCLPTSPLSVGSPAPAFSETVSTRDTKAKRWWVRETQGDNEQPRPGKNCKTDVGDKSGRRLEISKSR